MTHDDSIIMNIPDDVPMALITGGADELLHIIQDAFDARITVRGNVIEISGDSIELTSIKVIFGEMIASIGAGIIPDSDYVKKTIDLLKTTELSPAVLREDVVLTYRGRAIRPKTAAQKNYVDSIRQNTITFGLGPAGTGKTYLAMAVAVSALKRKEIGRIVLSRPIVEAGENLGFLPGTLTEKVDPYIRPLYDALYDMCDADRANHLLENGVIEIAPLAFMRGRTLNDSFIILDETQNTTPEQMKMFLTRLGFGSKMVITGDMSQTDLNGGSRGLKEAQAVLQNIDGIKFCKLTSKDVVRNSLVAAIVAAYDKFQTSDKCASDKRASDKCASDKRTSDKRTSDKRAK